LCPEESLCGFEEEEIFLADAIAACEKCGLAPLNFQLNVFKEVVAFG
jgi:hypothetical protein